MKSSEQKSPASSQEKLMKECFVSDAECTDIEIAPDGRIYLFGTSTQVMELLQTCGLHDPDSIARMAAESAVVSERPT